MAEKYLKRMPQGPIILHQVMDAVRSLCAKSTCGVSLCLTVLIMDRTNSESLCSLRFYSRDDSVQ